MPPDPTPFHPVDPPPAARTAPRRGHRTPSPLPNPHDPPSELREAPPAWLIPTDPPPA